MGISALLAIGVSFLVYLLIGMYYSKQIKKLADILPLVFNSTATVSSDREFSASTVATTISLATVVVAFFELVPALGLWLFWTVITTALGLFVFAMYAGKIWNKMSSYEYRPSLHEFIGTEFNSSRVAFIGSIFTVIGYLTAFAVELTVGSRFLAGLLPEIPQIFTVIAISATSFIYVFLGGFKATLVTDRIQMVFIWLMLGALSVFYIFAFHKFGLKASFEKIPYELTHIKWSGGLVPFILGILVMNVLMYLSNMGLWQRVAATPDSNVLLKGMKNSVLWTILSWSLFIIVAILAYTIVQPNSGENLLITLLKEISLSLSGRITIFFVTLGLFGAMLSTASTQLIAVSHTLYEDIFSVLREKELSKRLEEKSELSMSRFILFISAIVSVVVVEVLRILGFGIADLAFAIYGASLSLTPAILFSLNLDRKTLFNLKDYAWVSITFGFISGWSLAIYGRTIGTSNLVFLSPVIAFGVSSLILVFGYLRFKYKK